LCLEASGSSLQEALGLNGFGKTPITGLLSIKWEKVKITYESKTL
jgi:hypothetical protein